MYKINSCLYTDSFRHTLESRSNIHTPLLSYILKSNSNPNPNPNNIKPTNSNTFTFTHTFIYDDDDDDDDDLRASRQGEGRHQDQEYEDDDPSEGSDQGARYPLAERVELLAYGEPVSPRVPLVRQVHDGCGR